MSNSNSNNKDLFSKQSQAYSLYRPHYPTELFEFLASLVEKPKLAWDCATGNGQAAGELAKKFEKVYATDLSEKQLAQAVQQPNITYQIGVAESSGLNSSTIDLITVAQAFHWFNFEKFYQEVCRVAKPNAILALWTYNLGRAHPAVDQIINEFYGITLEKYWDSERKWVESGYSDIAVPFKELKAPSFHMVTDWSLDHLIGYLTTWSATQKWLAADPAHSVESVRNQFSKVWGNSDTLKFTWPLALRVFRINDK